MINTKPDTKRHFGSLLNIKIPNHTNTYRFDRQLFELQKHCNSFGLVTTKNNIVMAKQAGILQIEGTVDNMTFYKSQEGYLVRKKGSITKERILTDPAFVRTRENLNQFGLNAKAGKLIRNSITTLLKKGKDSRVSSRLSKVMSDVAKHDHVSVRGQKKVAIGVEAMEGMALLKGFNFNNRAIMGSILSAPLEVDMATGEVSITSIIPEEQVEAPSGATHVSFRTAIASIDFAVGESETVYTDAVVLPLNLTPAPVTLTPASVPSLGASAKTMVVLLLEFYQELDGTMYPLLSGSYNALCVVGIE